MTAKHFLEECLTYVEQRIVCWPRPAPFDDKLCRDVNNLSLTLLSSNIFRLPSEGVRRRWWWKSSLATRLIKLNALCDSQSANLGFLSIALKSAVQMFDLISPVPISHSGSDIISLCLVPPVLQISLRDRLVFTMSHFTDSNFYSSINNSKHKL